MRHAIGINNGNWRNGDLIYLLKDRQITDREIALEKIKSIMGNENFNLWYNKVYELRKSKKQNEYENTILGKLETLRNILDNIHNSQAWLERAKNNTEKKWASENLDLFQNKLLKEITFL